MKKFIFSVGFVMLLTLISFAQTQTPKVVEKNAKLITYGLLVDNSGSLRQVLEKAIEASRFIIEENNGDDQTFIVRFIDREKTAVIQPLTNQTVLLGNALDDLYVEGGQSAISNAILFSAKYLVENEKDASRQKLLILITDGDERADKKLMQETLDYLQQNKIKVYFLGLPSLAQNAKSATGFMQFYAAGTGGQVFIVDKTNGWKLAAKNLLKAVRSN